MGRRDSGSLSFPDNNNIGRMARRVCIVARNHPLLFGYLSTVLRDRPPGSEQMELVIDRRHALPPQPPEVDRRRPSGIEDELQQRGFAFVKNPGEAFRPRDAARIERTVELLANMEEHGWPFRRRRRRRLLERVWGNRPWRALAVLGGLAVISTLLAAEFRMNDLTGKDPGVGSRRPVASSVKESSSTGAPAPPAPAAKPVEAVRENSIVQAKRTSEPTVTARPAPAVTSPPTVEPAPAPATPEVAAPTPAVSTSAPPAPAPAAPSPPAPAPTAPFTPASPPAPVVVTAPPPAADPPKLALAPRPAPVVVTAPPPAADPPKPAPAPPPAPVAVTAPPPAAEPPKPAPAPPPAPVAVTAPPPAAEPPKPAPAQPPAPVVVTAPPPAADPPKPAPAPPPAPVVVTAPRHAAEPPKPAPAPPAAVAAAPSAVTPTRPPAAPAQAAAPRAAELPARPPSPLASARPAPAPATEAARGADLAATVERPVRPAAVPASARRDSVVVSAATPDNLRLELTSRPTSASGGGVIYIVRVTDSSGQPVPNAQVSMQAGVRSDGNAVFRTRLHPAVEMPGSFRSEVIHPATLPGDFTVKARVGTRQVEAPVAR
jgi:hypothetical protein